MTALQTSLKNTLGLLLSFPKETLAEPLADGNTMDLEQPLQWVTMSISLYFIW